MQFAVRNVIGIVSSVVRTNDFVRFDTCLMCFAFGALLNFMHRVTTDSNMTLRWMMINVVVSTCRETDSNPSDQFNRSTVVKSHFNWTISWRSVVSRMSMPCDTLHQFEIHNHLVAGISNIDKAHSFLDLHFNLYGITLTDTTEGDKKSRKRWLREC